MRLSSKLNCEAVDSLPILRVVHRVTSKIKIVIDNRNRASRIQSERGLRSQFRWIFQGFSVYSRAFVS